MDTLSKEAAKQEYRNYVDNHVRWLTHISINYSLSVIGLSAPQRRYAFCSLINSCNICIDSEGLLYKCEHDLGDPQFAIGDVYSGHSFCDRELSYAQTIESRHECVECKYLPVCMGGCLNDTIHNYFKN